jgi:serine/threonine protein phosphatase PrpC
MSPAAVHMPVVTSGHFDPGCCGALSLQLEGWNSAIACLEWQAAHLALRWPAAGDSRAVLCRGGKALQLSDDHKPNRPDEMVSGQHCAAALTLEPLCCPHLLNPAHPT